MKKEREQNQKPILALTLSLAALGALTGAFSFPIRRRIGERDGWECQAEGCTRAHRDGWFVTAAHLDHDRGSSEYDDEQNGRILCIAHHALEELSRGNTWGAKKLLAMGLYTREEAQRLGRNEYLTIDELLASDIK